MSKKSKVQVDASDSENIESEAVVVEGVTTISEVKTNVKVAIRGLDYVLPSGVGCYKANKEYVVSKKLGSELVESKIADLVESPCLLELSIPE